MSSAAFTRFVKASGALLIAIFSGLFILGFVIGETDLMSELFEKIGTIAEIGAIAAFSAALAHGSYFLLQTSEETESIYSGLVTLICFTILVSFGLFLDKRGEGRKYLKYKKIHQGIAVVFGIAQVVHLLFG